jgi:hypothetical protein
MIDFSFESFDEDDTSLSNRQKKVKKMLMRIENGEFLLIDCHDLKRKLDFFEETQISNLIDKKEMYAWSLLSNN